MITTYTEPILKWVIKHKILSVVLIAIISSTIYMVCTDTITYPYIMADRQVQSIRDCTFGSQSFETDTYGFSFTAPEGFCVLPNRIFPLDGSIEIVPKGWYFVFNEYAKGTVARGSRMTILFEPVLPDRDPEQIVETLVKGGFLDRKNISATTTSTGVNYTILTNTRGTDDSLYDWAFTTRPDGKYFVGIVMHHADNDPIWNHLLGSIKLL